MENAQQELLRHIVEVNKDIRCIHIRHEPDWDESTHENRYLPINYTQEQYYEFLEDLNLNYENGYGTQHLFGYIWFKDGTWSERYEYDGSEYWVHKSTPEIPTQCKP